MEELYCEQILEHYKRPQNFGALEDPDLEFEDTNPFCGDEQHVTIKLDDDGKVEEVMFDGKGCAISTAATSMLTDELAGKLSGGQKKLLEIGRLLMLEPSCIMLDEPFAGVNPVLIGQLCERIVELNRRGIAANIVIGQVVGNVTPIPLYLDSIGTAMIGVLAGPAAGAFTGIISNLIWGVTLSPSVIAFSSGAAFIGAAAGWAARLGAFRTPWFAVITGALAGVPAGALGAPVAAYVFGGGLGSGTGGVVAILQAAGLEMLNATLAQSLFSDIIDKALIFALAYTVVRTLPRRILDRYPFTDHSLSRSSRAPLRVGLQVERRGTLLSAVPKSGRSGDMVLVGVQYDYLQDGELALREVQNHVYRAGDAEQAPRDWPPAPDSPPSSDAPWQHVVQTDPIRLFRMSALTANSHRIHYDRPYATEVEGFRDLVVHGPMLAQQLAVLHRRVDPALRLARFDYRLLAPVFVGDPVAALGTPRGEDADLEVRSAPDRVHVSATASYRRRA